MSFDFAPSWPQLPELFYRRTQPTPVPSPRLLALNEPLALELGLDPEALRSPEGVAVLAGNRVPAGAEPLALAYAGHQFGHFVPQLGDGRALLLGEVRDRAGQRRDLQWKGSGRTPFSRGGDGRAALGPVLRELLASEAMAALGVPTTRVLAAVATGAPVLRDTPLPGAVLVRVATSHLRVGTFQFAAARGDTAALAALTDWALDRHFADRDRSEGAALALLDAVIDGQARLVARWLGVGFVHGVMNTDNTAIAGETLDYGPCAWLDGFEPLRTFSSIDHGRRYAYGRQPAIAQWNVARLADCLIPLVADDPAKATAALNERLATFAPRFEAAWADAGQAKLGLPAGATNEAVALAAELQALMTESKSDFTSTFSALATTWADDDPTVLLAELGAGDGPHAWWQRWRARLAADERPRAEVVADLRRANPTVVPRNHLVEAALSAAHTGDLAPFERLWRACRRPFEAPAEAPDLCQKPGDAQWQYRTFCGT
jgi:uncharacterized protein YdiU (UPF0061 family)